MLRLLGFRLVVGVVVVALAQGQLVGGVSIDFQPPQRTGIHRLQFQRPVHVQRVWPNLRWP